MQSLTFTYYVQTNSSSVIEGLRYSTPKIPVPSMKHHEKKMNGFIVEY